MDVSSQKYSNIVAFLNFIKEISKTKSTIIKSEDINKLKNDMDELLKGDNDEKEEIIKDINSDSEKLLTQYKALQSLGKRVVEYDREYGIDINKKILELQTQLIKTNINVFLINLIQILPDQSSIAQQI